MVPLWAMVFIRGRGSPLVFRVSLLMTSDSTEPTYNRFERARIIGARALQISMGAPIIRVDLAEGLDPVYIAEEEYAGGVVPITVSHLGRPGRTRARRAEAEAATTA